MSIELEEAFAKARFTTLLGDEDWRKSWGEALLLLAEQFSKENLDEELAGQVRRGLGELAGAFKEADRGITNPLFSVAKIKHRPPASTSENMVRMYLAIAVGLETNINSRLSSVDRATVYRHISMRINKASRERAVNLATAPIEFSQKEIESAWKNRGRLSNGQRAMMRAFLERPYTEPLRERIRGFLTWEIVRHIYSKGVVV